MSSYNQVIDNVNHFMFSCPFCKGKPEIYSGPVIGEKIAGERVYEALVECTKCGASTSTEKGIKQAAIIAAVSKWNSRHSGYYKITQVLGFPVIVSDLIPADTVIMAHAPEAERLLLLLEQHRAMSNAREGW